MDKNQSIITRERKPRRAVAEYQPANRELEDFVGVLSARRLVIAIYLFAFVVLTCGVTLMMTPKYESICRIEFNRRAAANLGMPEELGLDDSVDSALSIRTQMEAIRSDTVAMRVIQEQGLEKTAGYQRPKWAFWDRETADEAKQPLTSSPSRRERMLKLFHRNMKVTLVPGTRIIEVKYMDRDPNLAAKVDNAIVNTFLDEYYRNRFQANQRASEWLSAELDGLKTKLEASQRKVLEFQKAAGILGTDETHNIVTSKLEDLNRKLTEAQASRILHGAIFKVAQTHDPDLVIGLQSRTGYSIEDSKGIGLSLLQNLRSRQSALRQERAIALSKFGPAYPKIVQLDSELQEVDRQTDEEMQRTLSRAAAEYDAAATGEEMLAHSFEQQKEQATKQSNSAIQYTILKQQMESERSLYEELTKKLMESGAIAGIRSTNLSVVDPAAPASRIASPSWALNLTIGLLAGLLFGVIGAFVKEFSDKAAHSPSEMEQLTGAPTIGLVPDLRCRSVSGGIITMRSRLSKPFVQTPALSAPKSALAEIFRTIRCCLLSSRRDEAKKTILVTSSLPGEGKSTVAVNLAVVLAQQGGRVLLIDADMRRGTVHTILNLQQSPGLSDLLTEPSRDAERVIQRSGAVNLSVLCSGKSPAFPAELLSSAPFQMRLAEWYSQYDYIVMDSAPILSVTDPLLLANKADAIVMVARHGKTPKSTISRAVELLRQVGTRPSGVVLNGIDVDSPAYYQYFGFEFRGAYSRYYPQKLAQG